MEKQELFHLHELVAEVGNELVRSHPELEAQDQSETTVLMVDNSLEKLLELEEYNSINTQPSDVMDSSLDHKRAMQELADTLSSKIERISYDLDVEASGRPEQLENNETNKSVIEEKVETKTESEWNIPEEETVNITPDIREKIDAVDNFTFEVARELLDVNLKVEQDGEVYNGRIRKFDNSLSTFQISENGEITVVENPDLIEVENSPVTLRTVDLDNLDAHPLAIEQYDMSSNAEYISSVRERGGLPSLPRVIHNGDSLQIFDGHKGVQVARKADLDSHLVYVDDISEIEAAEEFVKDHVPSFNAFEAGYTDDSFYNEDQVENVVRLAEEVYGERASEIGVLEDYLAPDVEVPEPEELVQRQVLEQSIRNEIEAVTGQTVEDEKVEIIADRYYGALRDEIEEAIDYIERDLRVAAGAPREDDLEGTYEGLSEDVLSVISMPGYAVDT